jgi:two-component system chemotaxis response regulator CheY
MTRTVLLVDESPVVRSVIKIYLDGLPLTFIEAKDAKGALKILAGIPVDLVIADNTMAEMSGLSLVQRVRADQDARVRATPVFLVTADKSPELAARARQLGVTKLLQKPVSSGGLVETVQKLFATEAQDVARAASG